MPLCGTCQGFDLADLLDQDREVHDLVFHKSISKLRASASICDFCRLLWTTLTKDQAEDSDFFSALEKDDDHQSPVILRGIQYANDDYETGGVFRCKVRCDPFRPAGYVSFYSAEGDGKDGIPPGWEFSEGTFYQESNDLNLSFPYTLESSERSSFERDWNGMVAHYSSRGITKSFDKLPALSGLAKAMEERTGIGYAAGLWKKNMAHSLLWCRVGPWLRTPTDGYRAPSWSWAALEGGIANTVGTEYGYAHEATVDDIETMITPRGLDPRGMVKSGHLVLSGKVRAFDKRQNPQDPGYFHVVQANSLAKDAVSDYLLEKGEVVGKIIFDEPFKTNDQPLYCLQLVRRKENHSMWYGLILESTGREKEFRRLGRCSTEYVHNQMWFEDVPMERIKII
ncbi:hypothetical protein K4K49_004990 [Colletotrichum sp. SAR 10_70]|nr:hypothetical protein K4K50_008055 [Colletotrichum sp. SAR 10_71]KAI8189446.1 hypothetical protein K4K51_004614 [Colletotrichum sp. SAR 10_75]KAI8197789.1 hypothetical protein K4K49_004990 [Colletotrichum sp. SAR 10_70]KAI8205360.1 hypothetical protein KHU50_001846 [Colletotrichum sp. SAR 10_65]KAI8227954.1 hypothetical protein K4K54_002610 [Colletotrichum sp. SAR 10_86]KAJ5006765.1 hypothetical protein K4K48_002494 [Colletotrichum sp. SAR 10_66]